MIKKIKILLIGLLTIVHFETFAQDLDGFWVSDKKICIQFDSETKRININNFYDDINEGKQRFKFKVKDSILIIKWFHNQTLFGYENKKFMYSINSKNSNSIKLNFIKSNYRFKWMELLGKEEIILKKTTSKCGY